MNGCPDECTCNVMETRVKVLSRGLAETVRPSYDSVVVQFIHQSVKDYFVEKGLAALHKSLKPDEIERSNDELVGIAHCQLSSICLRYLAMDEFLVLENEEDAPQANSRKLGLRFPPGTLCCESVEYRMPVKATRKPCLKPVSETILSGHRKLPYADGYFGIEDSGA